MLKAAEFWAVARKMGRQSADDTPLDADMILAAQAVELTRDGDEAVIATTNVAIWRFSRRRASARATPALTKRDLRIRLFHQPFDADRVDRRLAMSIAMKKYPLAVGRKDGGHLGGVVCTMFAKSELPLTDCTSSRRRLADACPGEDGGIGVPAEVDVLGSVGARPSEDQMAGPAPGATRSR